jgi:hypothetical protein
MGNADDTCLCLLNTCMQPNLFTCSHAEGECEFEREKEMRSPYMPVRLHAQMDCCSWTTTTTTTTCIEQMQLQCNKLKREETSSRR